MKFSILAGFPLPRTCQSRTWGDGVVEIPSALWQIADRSFAPRVHTDITGREDFFAFVKPRLAVGPKKAKQTASLDNKSNGEYYARNDLQIGENWIASRNPLTFLSNLQKTENTTQIVSSKALKVAAGESAELPVNFSGAQTGVTFAAPPFIKVSLVNSEGEIEQTIEAHSAEATQGFKTFYTEKTGNKLLRFENTGDVPANVIAAIWNDTNPLALELVKILKQADGSVKMQAKLINNGAAVKGAAILMQVNNQMPEITLVDDGNHGDGAANDGIYGATTGKLAAGEHFIEAKAVLNGINAKAAAVLTIATVNE